MITFKSKREIELMKEAGHIVCLVFEALRPLCVPGVSTQELDDEADRVITANGGISGSKGYYDYPGSICISVNDTLIHGIPSKKIILREGDIVSLDVVVKKNGYYADAARTFPVGNISIEAQRLIQTTEESWWEMSKLLKEGVHLGDISHAIQEYNESHGYSLTRDYTGHGIGRNMHEDPSVPNVGTCGTGVVLKEGMTIAIEPMVNQGKSATRVLGDGWTVKTKDGKLASHYENTVAITKDGFEIITKLKEN